MRRIAILLALLLAGLVFAVAPAEATFHLEKVNEVMLASSGGDAGVQFVELLDRGGTEEQFTPVFAPYKLVIYDAAANVIGEQVLNPSGLRAASASGSEYLISTPAADSAFGVTGDERLSVSLPLGAGQACFEASPSPPAFSCVTWGPITKAVPTNSQGTGSAHGPVPPNGESDQRQPNDTVVAASPTPKTPNRSASSPSPTTPGTPTTQPGFAGVHLTARTLRVEGGRALARLSCPTGSGGCLVRLTLTTSGSRSGSAPGSRGRVASGRFRLAAGSVHTVAVRLTHAGRTQLARKRRLHTRALIKARDGAGHTKVTASSVLLVAG